MRSNQLLWILVLGFAAYWLFYKKDTNGNGNGNGSPDDDKSGSEFDVASISKNTGPPSQSNFAMAGNPNGAYTADIPVAEASISFL